MSDHHEPHAIIRTTATIATAYLANNPVDAALLPHLIRDIARSLQADVDRRTVIKTPAPRQPRARAGGFQKGDEVRFTQRGKPTRGPTWDLNRTGIVTGINRSGKPYVRWSGNVVAQLLAPERLELAP